MGIKQPKPEAIVTKLWCAELFCGQWSGNGSS